MGSKRNFATCHSHPQSLDSASTPEAFAERELELETGVITVTDHGTLTACRKVYDLAKAKGLIPVLGLEGYFRDDDCPILQAAGVEKNEAGSYVDYLKYCHITLHFLDQAAYECGVRLLSQADERAERHGSERKPIFTWAHLEELAAHNVTMTTGCLIGMVQRHMLQNNDFSIALRYYERLRSIVRPGNFFVEVFPHVCDRNFVQGVFVTLEDGTVLRFYDRKLLKTNKGEVFAGQLSQLWSRNQGGHEALLGVRNYRIWEDLPERKIVDVKYVEDFIKNECRPWAPDGDVQKGLNEMMLALAKKYNDPILIGDDSHFARPEEKIVQDVRLAQAGAWRFYGSYHRQSSDEAFAYFREKLGVSDAQFDRWVDNSHEWASRFKGFQFNSEPSLPTKFYEPHFEEYLWFRPGHHDNSLCYTVELIKKHGRMDWRNPDYMSRFKSEIEVLHNNGRLDLLPYFWIDEEVCSLYEQHGLLTGPGRGSAAGLLLTYLLGITHVDPLKYGLSQERFITADRIRSGKLPDIDQDLPNRDLLVDPDTGWLKQRFGDHFAQISVDATLKLKMAVKDVARMRYKHVPPDVEELTKRFKMPPQGVTDYDFVLGYDTDDGHQRGSIEYDPALQEYVRKYPEDWEVVQKCLGLARQKGRHACAYVIANRPIHEFIPLTTVSDVRVTQYTAPSVEAVGGLKMDFLVVNSLNDISDAIRMIQQRAGVEIPREAKLNGRRVPGHRLVPFNGGLVDIWDLPEDQAVFGDIARGETETVFQFNTPGAVKWLRHFGYQKANGNYAIDSIQAMAAFTALDRPGPLDMEVKSPDDPEKSHNLLVEYARRARGETPSPDVLSVFDQLLPETHGIMVYQEQLQRVYQHLTGCSGPEAEEFRSDVAKKKKSKIEKAYPSFMEKATAKIGEEAAKAAWQFFLTWAQYGFNKSHAVCYSIVGYACAFLKHHYPLEWWCAVLRHASKNEINEKFWRHCGHLVDLPDLQKSAPNFEIQGDRIRAPLSLLQRVGAAAHEQLCKYAPYTSIEDFCQKIAIHQNANSKTEMKLVTKKVTKKNRKTGETTIEEVTREKKVTKKGYNALHRKVVETLIVSGVMTPLFDDGTGPISIAQMLSRYEEAFATATNTRKRAYSDKYILVPPLKRFQMRKLILPIYSENLLRVLIDTKSPFIHLEQKELLILTEGPVVRKERLIPQYLRDGERSKKLRVVTGDELERTERDDDLLRPVTIATVAYIEAARIFTYGEERKEACELALDVDGSRFRWVKWSRQSGRLPDPFRQPLDGAVAIIVATKLSTDRPFVIEDIEVIESPLDLSQDESDDAEPAAPKTGAKE